LANRAGPQSIDYHARIPLKNDLVISCIKPAKATMGSCGAVLGGFSA
jgi:hypothetical protein